MKKLTKKEFEKRLLLLLCGANDRKVWKKLTGYDHAVLDKMYDIRNNNIRKLELDEETN